MRKMLLLAAVAALAGIPAALSAPLHLASNTRTYADSIGEDASAPDITGVTVSNDDAGVITFQVNISNRPALTADMYVLIFLDTDQNDSTGTAGADYIVELDPGSVSLFKWNGTTYAFATSQSSLTYAYGATGATIRVSASDLGKVKMFDFGVVAASGVALDGNGNPDLTNERRDNAPDPGHGFFTYQVLTKLVLSVTAFTTTPKPARSGAAFSATLAANENDTAGPVQSGTVSCVASIASKRIVATTHSLANGVASCTWRVPKTATGKLLRGTITVTKEGVSISRSFSSRIS